MNRVAGRAHTLALIAMILPAHSDDVFAPRRVKAEDNEFLAFLEEVKQQLQAKQVRQHAAMA